MSRKFLIAISAIFSIMIGLWIWTLAIPKNVINIGGSASVDPIMQRATSKYNHQQKGQNSFIYSSTGSTSGINNLKSKVYEIGFISKAVPEGEFSEIKDVSAEVFTSHDQFKAYFDQTENQGIYHSINFANDAIVFIYNIRGTGFAPFSEKFSFAVNEEGLVDKENNFLHQIYEHDRQADLIKWRDLAQAIMDQEDLWGKTDEVSGKPWDELFDKVQNVDVTPYASTPGSGTRTSFENLTGVKAGQAVNQYGNNGSFFAQISASSGAFGFVNLAFAQEIFKSKFTNLKTAIIENADGSEKWNIGENEGDPFDYPLTRPFYAIFYNDPANDTKSEVLDFIYWFATSEDLALDYEEEGLSQIMVQKLSQKVSMNKKVGVQWWLS